MSQSLSRLWTHLIFSTKERYGYGAFSVSQSHLDRVYRYIEQQEHHHWRITFQDEYRSFLKKYGIEYNEDYLWN